MQVPAEQAFEPVVALQKTLSNQLERTIQIELLLGVTVSLLGLLVLAFAARAVVQPLQSMAVMVDALGQGDAELSRRAHPLRSRFSPRDASH